MDYRRRKQTIIVSILAVFLTGILTALYFAIFYSPATCFDGKQNQKEEGVDCGGPCMSCERRTIKDIKILSTNSIFLKEQTYDLVAQVENPNPNYGLSQFSYFFKVYDIESALVKEIIGTDFILPGETKYIIEANVGLGKALGRLEFEIKPVDQAAWQKLSEDYETPNLYIHDRQLKLAASPEEPTEATGIIKNDSLFDFERIVVTIVLFDDKKEIIATNKTEARTILAGEDRYFSALWFTPLRGEIKSVDMKAVTNLFLDENFMRRFGVQEKFQQY